MHTLADLCASIGEKTAEIRAHGASFTMKLRGLAGWEQNLIAMANPRPEPPSGDEDEIGAEDERVRYRAALEQWIYLRALAFCAAASDFAAGGVTWTGIRGTPERPGTGHEDGVLAVHRYIQSLPGALPNLDTATLRQIGAEIDKLSTIEKKTLEDAAKN